MPPEHKGVFPDILEVALILIVNLRTEYITYACHCSFCHIAISLFISHRMGQTTILY